jgi:hypothetical protein
MPHMCTRHLAFDACMPYDQILGAPCGVLHTYVYFGQLTACLVNILVHIEAVLGVLAGLLNPTRILGRV